MKKMWGKNSVWKTEAQFWTWLRGGIRRAVWNRHPNKILLINQERFKAPIGKQQNEVWCLTCAMCNNIYRQGDCQVDHINPAGSFKSVDDIQTFILNIAFVEIEDLRILCKSCHSVVTYAERYEVSLEEAKKRKDAIARRKKK